VTWHWQKIKNRDYKRKEKMEFNPQRRIRSERAKKAIGDIL
jgi:hypothetical protein